MLDGLWGNQAAKEDDCPRCSLRLTPGIAFAGAPPGITYEGEWPASLVDCRKCAQCGYSERVEGAHIYLKSLGQEARKTWNPNGAALKGLIS